LFLMNMLGAIIVLPAIIGVMDLIVPQRKVVLAPAISD
jgi:hypothetical protein